MLHRQAASLADAFERALEEIRTRVSISSFAIAYSGGLDSAALLHLAGDYAVRHGLQVFAFHVHHGLSPNADAWLAHCERECVRRRIRFDARRINLDERKGDSIEQAARNKRYAALSELCRAHQVPLLLTAHHQDDQAETVLLQMIRGSGVAGISGMRRAGAAPGLLGDPDLILGRPLLDVTRNDLESFVVQHRLEYVSDESNADARYARNALRHHVFPSLAAYFPGFQERFVRVAHHAQAAQSLLDELAAQDLAGCLDREGINVGRLKTLSAERGNNMLRYWFSVHGMRMPSTAWLSEMRSQLLDARDDAQILVTHPEGEIRRHRGRVFLTPRRNTELHCAPLAFRWHGEARMAFPAFGGALYFDMAEQGVDADWLRAQQLELRHRHGGEKLKLAPNRSTKSLKHHYQNLDVPAWERSRLPMVTASGSMLFAAGIGMDCRNAPTVGENGIRLRWQADPT